MTDKRPTWPVARWLLWPGPPDSPGHLWPRWLLLRCLGLVFFSAFYSLAFQIHGLIGPDGILPAGSYLQSVAKHRGVEGLWYAPTLLWLGSGPVALHLLCWAGLIASALLVMNIWPRATLLVCGVAFLSFVAAAQDFSAYQSDGMLLEAAVLALFFAPPGLRPGLGESHPPSRASLFMLQWLWFRIYFESGLVKLLSGDAGWRHLTALDLYYQNGPLPDWIGWHVQQMPHRFHAAVALLTLVVEVGLVWLAILPRRFRLLLFCIVTPFQIGIILTANLAFLNYFVLVLGVLLLDDGAIRGLFPRLTARLEGRNSKRKIGSSKLEASPATPNSEPGTLHSPGQTSDVVVHHSLLNLHRWKAVRGPLSLLFLGWLFYNTAALLLLMVFPRWPLPLKPIMALEPFRISNQYGLFAVMTLQRYELEFQGSRDGQNWTPYPFRYKPQDISQPPRIHAPYQPRFDWNLWFATLGGWRENPFVARTEVCLLRNSPTVLSLFAGNPFPGQPPRQVRVVMWQYWFTDRATKRKEGLWWRRELRGLYAPTLAQASEGKIAVVQWPDVAVPSSRPGDELDDDD